MLPLSSGVPVSTTSATALTLIHSSALVNATHILIQVRNGAEFDWSLDGGVTWCRVLADPNGNPLRMLLPGQQTIGHTLQIRRATATDLTDVVAAVW